MQADFWHSKWRDQQIGFHQEKINSRLVRHWPQLRLVPGSSVFVPLCGKSLDMAWLAGQGLNVVGVELSALACEQFFAENGMDPAVEQIDSGDTALTRYSSSDISLWAGDFFDLPESVLADVGGVYDRAALIALPKDMRKRYAEALEAKLPGGVKMLVITMQYDEAKMSGPPFPVSEEEVRDLFANDFDVKLIAESSGPEIVGNLRERGLDTLKEQVFLISKP